MSSKTFSNPVARHLASLKSEHGKLNYSLIGKYLHFDEDYYLDLNQAFDPDLVNKYNLQSSTDLKQHDQPPNCMIYGPINNMNIINNNEEKIKCDLSSIISKISLLKQFLVLNFGSYTWQPFATFGSVILENVAKKHQDIAKFITIYIAEAHAIDEWNIYSNIEQIKQHCTINDRFDAAQCFIDKTKTEIDVYLDDIDNNSLKLYSSSPDRLYIIDCYQNEIAFVGNMGPDGYKPEEIDAYLAEYKCNSRKNKMFKYAIFTGFALLTSYFMHRH